MLDYAALSNRTKSLSDVVAPLDVAALAAETNEMTDTILGLIADCGDTDVTFEPVDPKANDTYATNPDETSIAWTLGHVIVHITASQEESAALGAEMARGVAPHGRSRYETPWETVKTIAECRERLEESRRMCKGSLLMWPSQAHLNLTAETWPGGPVVDARGRYIIGLVHTYSHLEQIAEIVRQAKAARA